MLSPPGSSVCLPRHEIHPACHRFSGDRAHTSSRRSPGGYAPLRLASIRARALSTRWRRCGSPSASVTTKLSAARLVTIGPATKPGSYPARGSFTCFAAARAEAGMFTAMLVPAVASSARPISDRRVMRSIMRLAALVSVPVAVYVRVGSVTWRSPSTCLRRSRRRNAARLPRSSLQQAAAWKTIQPLVRRSPSTLGKSALRCGKAPSPCAVTGTRPMTSSKRR